MLTRFLCSAEVLVRHEEDPLAQAHGWRLEPIDDEGNAVYHRVIERGDGRPLRREFYLD